MTRKFIDRFQYYRDSYLMAMMQGDEQIQRLWETYEAAHPHFDDNTEYAMSLLEQGAALARKLDEPCWELLFEFWLYEGNDYREQLLDRIVKLFVKANQPRYRECPLLGDVYAALLRAYLWHDPLGYENEIQDGLVYVLEHLPLPQDTFCSILWTKMRLHLEMWQYDDVLETVKTYFRYCEGKDSHLAWAYIVLLQAYYQRGDYVPALQAAKDCEAAAERKGNESLLFAALKWQITIFHYMDDKIEMDAVGRRLQQFDLSRIVGYDALHEAQYEFDRRAFGWLGKLALMRGAEVRIEKTNRANRPYAECKTRLRRLAAFRSLPWLLQLVMRVLFGVPSTEQQVADARTAAEKLIKPERMLERISQVEQGDISML